MIFLLYLLKFKHMKIEEKIQKNIPLAPFSTFKIGGPAKYFIEIKDKEEIKETFKWAQKEQVRIFILGGGSNLIINDDGVDGLVIKLKNDEIAVKGERIECGGAAVLAKVARLAAGNNLSGLEWAIGIPSATIGGSILGNAGAFGQCMADTVETVEVYDFKKTNFGILSKNFCKFSYRSSLFKESRSHLIFKAILKLNSEKPEKINEQMEKVLKNRINIQPKLPNAGCVFKNLTIDEIMKNNEWLANKAKESGAVKAEKVGAGWLIDMADLKGKTIGGAKVSLEHANFVVNTGQASSEDIIMLISFIKQQIRNKFKIQLYEEVQYFGF